ncbi:hypothetical protein INT48_007451 [Thamnidium elegans]|uniref:RNA helicase n=1 Tax=Thamnidium elegans TaxID=101142 RepID=A0A8H7VSX5_9FUNG|nr:hypothetical protein INT48_007451 [Thamnidium elegans]
MSSRKEPSRSRWENIDWESPDLSSTPTVVNATLNSLTNEFEVSKPKTPSRSKFDFGSNNNSNGWIHDAERGWDSSPNVPEKSWDPCYKPVQDLNAGQQQHKFSSGETAVFRLNMDMDDTPVFSKVVDYTAFRNQDIIPDYDDIITAEELKDPEVWENRNFRTPFPDIPINRIKTPYDNADQYLYTHFELMRQDFLIPLQKAVKAYKEVYNYTKTKDDQGLAMETASNQQPYRLYEHVRLNAIVFGSRQPLYRISFRLPYYCRVNWPQSKRLMPGTLVLLSKDHFDKDLKIATIVERGDEPMRGANRFEYLLDLYLERDNENQPFGFGDPTMINDDTYVMIEATDGYFEAYRHVLNVFQRIKPTELPFKQYLVDLSNEVMLPHYAARKGTYDINVHKRVRGRERWNVDINREWPVYNTGMDKTQMDALKTILSHNLSIVQGPPGTGKTYVGTYAMQVLLNNFDFSLGPIVCICQTNHALDQFLEHIYKFDEKIVRVGGRSKSELLKDNTLYELKKIHERPRGLGRMYRSRDELGKEIRKALIELYEEPCVSIDFITSTKALNPRQIESLKRISERNKNRPKQSAANTFINDDSDSDDDWEISSIEPVTKKAPIKNTRGNPAPAAKSRNKGVNNSWAGGNPNRVEPVKEKKTNPVEVWLADAIDFIDDTGMMSTIAEEMKQTLLEKEKGLIFDDDPDDRDLIEEEELKEVTQEFRGDDDSRAFKNPFIQIGKAYKKQNEPGPGEGPERKVVNYQKIRTATDFEPQKFNFFDDSGDDGFSEEENNKYSLERWTKENDVSMWPLPVRLKAHKIWVDQRNAMLEQKMNMLMKRYVELSNEIRKTTANFEAKICREHRVVGMTSTAAAKYHDLLEEMRPRVMVVEEAAEMLESHIISAVTRSLEHLILIGDHQQLRPSTAVHALAENHALGVSLFERLVKNDFPFTRLSHQRRMRPEIRTMINPIYIDPPLKDHPDVLTYPPIKGMEQSLFFLAHTEDETHLSDSASKVNEHEAKMAAKLSVYLLLQGYRTEDITIITMYAGQKSLIKKALREERRAYTDPEPIQVSSVDGFQGEENKIIILSLVRSNANGQIGFLKVVNRVCVSLSRAKYGFYILGNASLLCEKSDLWNEIIGNLENQSTKMIGTKLPLKCKKHNVITEVQWPVDFTEVEEGGCTRTCGEFLPCGHKV